MAEKQKAPVQQAGVCVLQVTAQAWQQDRTELMSIGLRAVNLPSDALLSRVGSLKACGSQVNAGAPDMSDMAQRMGISSLPYFQFYKDGKLATQFTANLLSVNRLRAAIAANKDCADAGSNACQQASLAL